MTALVSLIFIDMIHIDCKITNFSLYLLVYFFFKVTIIIFGELKSTTSKKRITTNIIFARMTTNTIFTRMTTNTIFTRMTTNTIFVGATPIN